MSRASTRRRARPRRLSTDPLLTITSMVDIFTILLTFLLNFVHPAEEGGPDLLLPDSSSTRDLEDAPALVVSKSAVRVGETDVLLLAPGAARLAGESDTELLVAALRQALDAAGPAASAGEGAALVVHADRDTPYALLAEILAAARVAGFVRFRFVVDGPAG